MNIYVLKCEFRKKKVYIAVIQNKPKRLLKFKCKNLKCFFTKIKILRLVLGLCQA